VRVLLDANLFISYLLLPHGRNHPTVCVAAALRGQFTLLVPGAVLHELAVRIPAKRWLADRIEISDIQALVGALLAVGELLPEIDAALPAVSRDRKDDYLLAYAVVGGADYLVTGDQDLLDLGAVEGVTIIRPADFARVLAARGLIN
jgi:hypothetical protein